MYKKTKDVCFFNTCCFKKPLFTIVLFAKQNLKTQNFVFSQIVYSSGLTIIAKLHLTDMPSKRAAAGKHVELHSRPDESI